MIDLARAREQITAYYWPLVERSAPFGDVVLPGQAASHLMHVTDLVWTRYILGGLPLTDAQREAWAGRIRRDQDPATGLFRYPPGCSHIDEHATWQSVAALNMLGHSPGYRLACLEPLLSAGGFRAWCDAYHFQSSHHRFFLAVIAAASTPVTEEWKAVFGDWYAARQDPATGLPCPTASRHWLSPLFLLTTLRWAFCGSVPLAARILDSVLGAQRADGGFLDSDLPGYMEMDAAFLLHLLADEVDDRVDSAAERIGDFVEAALEGQDSRQKLLADPHRALAACGTLAVLQRHFGLGGAPMPFPWAEVALDRAAV